MFGVVGATTGNRLNRFPDSFLAVKTQYARHEVSITTRKSRVKTLSALEL